MHTLQSNEHLLALFQQILELLHDFGMNDWLSKSIRYRRLHGEEKATSNSVEEVWNSEERRTNSRKQENSCLKKLFKKLFKVFLSRRLVCFGLAFPVFLHCFPDFFMVFQFFWSVI